MGCISCFICERVTSGNLNALLQSNLLKSFANASKLKPPKMGALSLLLYGRIRTRSRDGGERCPGIRQQADIRGRILPSEQIKLRHSLWVLLTLFCFGWRSEDSSTDSGSSNYSPNRPERSEGAVPSPACWQAGAILLRILWPAVVLR